MSLEEEFICMESRGYPRILNIKVTCGFSKIFLVEYDAS
jgi:hypothetical protein